ETDPYGGLSQYLPGTEPGAQVSSTGTYQQPTGSQYLPGSEPTPYSPAPIPSGSIAQSTQNWTPADLAAMIAAANAGNQTTTPTTQTTATTQPYVNQQYTNYQQPIVAQPMAQTTTTQPITDPGSLWNDTSTPEAPPVFNQPTLGAVTPPSAL